MSPGVPELLSIIKEEIVAHGPMTFARFMELALYHPSWGYYMRAPRAPLDGQPAGVGERQRIGWSGDFYTSSDVHAALGWALSVQIEQMDRLLGSPPTITIVEMGPGKGLLARDILETCAAQYPSLFNRLRYVLIDRSPAHRAIQRGTLKTWLHPPGRVDWRDGLEGFEANSLTGVVLSNELVDAFPVHRVTIHEGSLRERLVAVVDGRLTETTGPLTTPALAAYFERLGLSLREGVVAEVNLQALQWMRDVASRLKQGFAITIDYGHTAADLYCAERRNGTLRSYVRHHASDDALTGVGEQDVTSHVDFTSLAQAGRDAGLAVTGFTNQMSFLVSLGIEEYCTARPESSSEMLAIAHLMRPHGMGTTFKVLLQHKGLPSATLRGVRYSPFFESTLEIQAAGGTR